MATQHSAARPLRTRFFWAIALALSATLLFGFARSFYLQPLFGAEPLTAALLIHGICGTAWFGLLVWQAWLGARGRVADHRRWGRYGPWVAASVVVSALWIVAMTATDGQMTGSGLPESAGLLIQLTTTGWFAGLVTLGFWHRMRPALHKRLMILATITMMAPAFARISRLFRDGGPPPFDSSIFAAPFIIALAVYDWRSMGRMHPVTLWAGGLYLMWTQIRMPLARSDAWTNFITPLLGG
jgi:hypothetical protein